MLFLANAKLSLEGFRVHFLSRIISDQRYYGLYGPQDSNSIDGFIYGTLNVSGNQVISSDGIDFFY